MRNYWIMLTLASFLGLGTAAVLGSGGPSHTDGIITGQSAAGPSGNVPTDAAVSPSVDLNSGGAVCQTCGQETDARKSAKKTKKT